MRPAAQKAGGPPALCEFATDVISSRLDRMLSHIEGVRAGATPEPIHQMRVWARRTRAAMSVFAPCFPRKRFMQLEKEIKAAADAIGEARDLDVMIGVLTERMAHLPQEQHGGVLQFLEELGIRRTAAQKRVSKAMQRLDSRAPAVCFRALAGLHDGSTPPEADSQQEEPHGESESA